MLPLKPGRAPAETVGTHRAAARRSRRSSRRSLARSRDALLLLDARGAHRLVTRASAGAIPIACTHHGRM